MALCPDCRYEYEPGITLCPDCGAPLVDALPEASRGPHENDYVLLTKVGEQEASSLHSFLKSEGFHPILLLDQEGAVMRMYVGRSCFGAEIHVPKEELSEAKEALAAFRRPPDWSRVDFGKPDEPDTDTEGGTSDFQSLQRFMHICFRIVAVLLMLAFGIRFFLTRWQ